MPLLDIIVTTVGTAIVRKIVEVWVKDGDFSLEISYDLAEYAWNTYKDKILQRSINRQFQVMEEKSARSLFRLFEKEHDIDDGTKEAIIYALEFNLKNVELSEKLFFEKNLDAQRLGQYLFDNKPQDTLVGILPDYISFYKQLLFEACDYIMSTFSRLERFEEKSFKELFNQQDILLKRLEEAIEEIQKIRISTELSNREPDFAKAEEKYLRAVAERLNELELYGAPTRVNRRYTLSVAYISLLAHIGNQEDVVPQSVNQVLSSRNRILIKGAAGSGKTTLLKWIAVKSSLKQFDGDLENWNKKVPFFIKLREFAQLDFPTPNKFPHQLVTTALHDEIPSNWVKKLIEQGRAIILIDGVDELAKKDELKKWIRDLTLVCEPAGNIIIVTSRPTAIENNWLQSLSFEEAELQPMEITQMENFIDHWHEAIYQSNASQSQDTKEIYEKYSNNIKQVIKTTQTIRNLATSPLLCALLCALNRDTEQRLPRDRRELYQACLDMLIYKRDNERNVDISRYPNLTDKERLFILRNLAYHMMDNSISEIAKESVIRIIQGSLNRITSIKGNVDSEGVLRLLLERTGIIRETTINHLDFSHRTFQEYLAAQKINNDGNIYKLISMAKDDQWRETIILAAGEIRTKERDDLIQSLIELGQESGMLKTSLYLLAFSCLETSIESLSEETEKLLDKHIKAILPPSNMTQAQAIAAAGNLAVKHLGKDIQKLKAPEAAACVRALSLIGTEEALTQIEKFAKDERKTVHAELIRAAQYFDLDEYGERVLSNMKVKDLLDIESHFITPFLAYAKPSPEIENLSIDGNFLTSKLVKNLPNLKILNVGNTNQSILETISKITSLQELTISEYDVLSSRQLSKLIENSDLDLTLLNDFDNLVSIKIENDPSFFRGGFALSGVLQNPNLRILEVHSKRAGKLILENNGLNHILIDNPNKDFLAEINGKFSDLISLQLRLQQKIQLAFLEISPLLEYLTIIGEVEGLEFLGKIDTLQHLYLDIKNYIDFSLVSHMSNLRTLILNVPYNIELKEDLSKLSQLKKLVTTQPAEGIKGCPRKAS